MSSLNVKSGDNVLVITGKDAGKQGKVLKVFPKTNRIIVSGVNTITKHQKARKAQDKSQIVKTEGTIDVSNVMVVCPVCGKPTRVKHTVNEAGKSVRVCKCGGALDKKYVKDTKKAAKKSEAEVKEAKAEKAKTTPAEKPAAAKKPAEKKVTATSENKTTKVAGAKKSSQRGV